MQFREVKRSFDLLYEHANIRVGNSADFNSKMVGELDVPILMVIKKKKLPHARVKKQHKTYSSNLNDHRTHLMTVTLGESY